MSSTTKRQEVEAFIASKKQEFANVRAMLTAEVDSLPPFSPTSVSEEKMLDLETKIEEMAIRMLSEVGKEETVVIIVVDKDEEDTAENNNNNNDSTTTKIFLRGKDADKSFIIDTCDAHLFKNTKWYLDKNKGHSAGPGYAFSFIMGKRTPAHHLIWRKHHPDAPTKLILDHRDRNKSNNCLFNLREATKSQNQWNHSMHKQNKAGFKGVHVATYEGKKRTTVLYQARIVLYRKVHGLGSYKLKEEAALAYNYAAHWLHRDFAFFNKVNNITDTAVRRSIREGVARRLEAKGLIIRKKKEEEEEEEKEPQKEAAAD